MDVPLGAAPILALGGAIACYCFFLFGRIAQSRPARALWERFGPATRYLLWLAKAWTLFGLASLAGLAILGRTGALLDLPPEFSASAARLGPMSFHPSLVATTAIGGMAAGALLGLWIGHGRARRGRPDLLLDDLSAVQPRNRRELLPAAALAVSAGIVEELFFRLLLPLTAAMATGSAGLGFALALAMFGFAHRYQRWAGVAAALLTGAALSVVYLATAELWLAVLLHALLNLNGLVLQPALRLREPCPGLPVQNATSGSARS